MGSSSPQEVTQTSTSNSVPFNSSQILDYQNRAVNLANNYPIQYPSFPTIANNNQAQYDALNGAGQLGQSSGMALAGLIPGAQAGAVTANTNIANGGINNALAGQNAALTNLGSANPAAGAMSQLNPVANGSYYNQLQPQLNNLAGFGTNSTAAQGLQGIAGGPAAGLGAAAYGPNVNGLSGLTTGAAAQGLYGTANGTAAQGLAGLGAGAGTAAQSLADTASGQYLNSNPYLDSMFNAAAAPVTRAYQTATAPQTASAFEASGRTNSGAAQNAQSVNQRNLGDALGNLSANIYGTNYANERNLQNSAASALGGLQNTSLSNLGNLQNTSLANLGNLQSGALAGAGQLQNSALSNQGSLLNTAYSNLGSLDEQAQNAALTQQANQLGLINNAASNSGQLGVSGQNAQTSALNAAVGNQLTGAGLQQNAINATPALNNMALTDWQTLLNAGTTQQGYNQAAINNQVQNFLGQQQAPWSTAQQEASLIGSPIPGITTTQGQTPYYQPSGASQLLGGALGAAQLAPTLFGAPAAGGLVGKL